MFNKCRTTGSSEEQWQLSDKCYTPDPAPMSFPVRLMAWGTNTQ